ncbi:uncharacterized protein B0H18DRAFT_412142 [Fomitopsis serialis]|uniref:uncharacterized protein n=1 Tax=Fomitopsis serialis TaxID=139415 RepID=UPI0020087986|nr:uncharacterized protein B0H18DRAFT_412142 [Neoantrodia serialis]KAH9935389.1 hypothetical protein B0H18DRAFT_412142 [Neoantrodia serialis]
MFAVLQLALFTVAALASPAHPADLLVNSDITQSPFTRPPAAFYSPLDSGGTMFDNTGNGLGEPLNVIISGFSSPKVVDSGLDGIVNYARAIGFSEECLDIHLGSPFSANLGDGNGWVNQTIELRQDYGSSEIGTCLESLIGGNHFRVYIQNGPGADSGALFLAVSKEEDVETGHDIVPDGYNIGRDQLVAHAIGLKSFDGISYYTVAQNVTGLMPAGSAGVNHGIAVDGIVTLLTVSVTEKAE